MGQDEPTPSLIPEGRLISVYASEQAQDVNQLLPSQLHHHSFHSKKTLYLFRISFPYTVVSRLSVYLKLKAPEST